MAAASIIAARTVDSAPSVRSHEPVDSIARQTFACLLTEPSWGRATFDAVIPRKESSAMSTWFNDAWAYVRSLLGDIECRDRPLVSGTKAARGARPGRWPWS